MAIKAEELQEIETLLDGAEARFVPAACAAAEISASDMVALRRVRRDRGAFPLFRGL